MNGIPNNIRCWCRTRMKNKNNIETPQLLTSKTTMTGNILSCIATNDSYIS